MRFLVLHGAVRAATAYGKPDAYRLVRQHSAVTVARNCLVIDARQARLGVTAQRDRHANEYGE